MNLQENRDIQPILFVVTRLMDKRSANYVKEMKQKYADDLFVISDDASMSEGSGDSEFNRLLAQLVIFKGGNVLVDMGCMSRKDRAPWLQLEGCCKTAIIITQPLEAGIEYGIDPQIRRFQIPTVEEGFESITVLNENSTDTDICQSLNQLVMDIPHTGVYHKESLREHIFFVRDYFSSHFDYGLAEQFGAAFHDVGKPFVYTVDEKGNSHFYNHENVGAYYLISHFEALRGYTGMSADQLLLSIAIVNYHFSGRKRDRETADQNFSLSFADLLRAVDEADTGYGACKSQEQVIERRRIAEMHAVEPESFAEIIAAFRRYEELK